MDIKTLEKRVLNDIANARESFNIIKDFVDPIFQKSDEHHRHRDWPLTAHILRAAVDSVICSLGRLLQPNARRSECTLLKYKNEVIKKIKEKEHKSGTSSYSVENAEKLKDREYVNSINKKTVDYQKKIFPIRDQLVSHSDMGFNWINSDSILPILSECIGFTENLHRTCHSALDDAGMVGEYISPLSKEVADDWINCLLKRQKRKVK